MEKKQQKQLDLFNGKLEIKLADSTNIIDDLRISPFLPLVKISKLTTTYKNFIENKNILERTTPYGKIRIRNRLLTQTHKDLLNTIFVLATINQSKSVDKEKRLVMTFSKYELLQKMNLADGGKNYKMIDELLAEIKDTVIDRVGKDLEISYNIIDDKGAKDDGYAITLSKVYSRLYITNWTLNLTKRIDELLLIKGEGSGVIKSIIDHFITHTASDDKRVYLSLDKIINIINYPIDTERQLTQIKSFIKKYKKQLNSFGIDYNIKTQIFTYIGTEDINKYPPLILED